MSRILVIDDDRLLRSTLERILKSEGHEVASARDGHEGLKRFRSGHFDLVACDIFMPNMEGLETIREIRSLCAALPLIAFTGRPACAASPGPDIDFLRMAGQLGGMETLAKPFRRQELLTLVRRCLPSADGPLPDPKNGAAAKPGGTALVTVAIGAIGRPIRRAAIDIGRLVGGSIRHLAIFISKWLERDRERRQLQSLGDDMLKDMGVSRCDVEREIRAGWFDR